MPSLFNKIAAAITPEPGDKARAEAREKARAKAQSGDWLALVLDHHRQIEDAFGDAKAGTNPTALKRLAILLLGHGQAEESVLYPAMAAEGGEKGRAGMGYDEQAIVKVEMAKLEQDPPGSDAYQKRLEEIRSAVSLHMYQEEGTWFPKLHEEAGADNARLSQRFREEFERYAGGTA